VGRIFSSLDDGEFNRLFFDFQYTAYRLETLQRYAVSYEQSDYSRFLAGEPCPDVPAISEWVEGTVVKAVAAGKHMNRVHVVEEPVSDYVRFECAWEYERTVAAGEDVRIIPVRQGKWPAGLPCSDYWLFDSAQLVVMHYANDGAFIAAEMVDDPAKVVRANFLRDLAVHQSIPYKDFSRGPMQNPRVRIAGFA
jgi:hypothetical protein